MKLTTKKLKQLIKEVAEEKKKNSMILTEEKEATDKNTGEKN